MYDNELRAEGKAVGEMVAATVAVMAVVATEEVTAEEVAKVEVAVVRVAGAKEEVERAMAVVAWMARSVDFWMIATALIPRCPSSTQAQRRALQHG